MATFSESQPVILLSPPPPQRNSPPTPSLSTCTFKSLSRKLSSLSLRSSPPSPRPGEEDLIDSHTNQNTNSSFLLIPNDESFIKSTSIIIMNDSNNSMYLPPSPTYSAYSTPCEERAQPSVILQDKYKDHKKGRKIGSGATAKLRILEPPLSSKNRSLIAIKTFRKRDNRDESKRGYDKRMASEFCISKTLSHQHVVQVFDLLKDKKGRWCTVMEYVSFSIHFGLVYNINTRYIVCRW